MDEGVLEKARRIAPRAKDFRERLGACILTDLVHRKDRGRQASAEIRRLSETSLARIGRRNWGRGDFISVSCFLDANILVNAAAGRGKEDWKRLRALNLIETVEFGLSAQALQEFYVAVTRKIAVALAPDSVTGNVEY